MARYIKPLEDFIKRFEVKFMDDAEYEEFENNGGIWAYQPFLDYMDTFSSDDYGYSVYSHTERSLFGVRTEYYTIKIYKIGKSLTQ